MTIRINDAKWRRAAWAALAAGACLMVSTQEFGNSQSAPRPVPTHPASPARQPAAPATRPMPQTRQMPPVQQDRPRGTNLAPYNVPQSVPQPGQRPEYPGAGYFAPADPRPASPAPRFNTPPGHLQSWLNEHRNAPVQKQEQTLRNDPSFRRLPPTEQQKLLRQFNGVNQLPEEQRERRLARAENLERLSPMDRMRVSRSAREWHSLPEDRQSIMRNAFRDLRAVPPDQRGIVLNSARYQGQFSPQERGILSDMLRVEPYQPAQ